MKGAKNMSEIQNAIEVKNLKKGFGGRVLFENFSLNVKANTIHAIIGPNGSGKTTLLRLITGVYQPNAGTINIAGKYAMELENDYLYEEQTGLENLRIFGKYFGFEINDRSDSYCTQLGLTEHLGKRVSTYSKGMKRKLSLLIVIMMGRDILLMDEPTSGVDPISRVEIRSLIEALKADGKTVIITSHDLSEIEKCADDVSMIKNGRLLFDKGIQEMQGQSFAVIHLGDMEARYKELTKYYELTNYIANEREDFSRLLHNDVLQDIGGAKNLLSLRSPDVDETKRILSDLELRVRNMMNFYSSNIFSGYASWEHIGYMLDAIKKLYPKKNILVDFTIDSEARIALKKDNSLEQTMQIIKELVNNVYKHAAATFIHLEIALNEESRLVITCQNDGAKPNDIENILSSKGGMLFLTVLINGNGGNIQYLEKDGILTATAVLGRKNEDITI